MSDRVKKVLKYVLPVLALLAIGFFAGRLTVKEHTKTVVKYIRGDTVIGNVDIPRPQKEIPPIDTANIIKQCIKEIIINQYKL